MEASLAKWLVLYYSTNLSVIDIRGFNFRNINFFFLIFSKQSLSLSVDAANTNAVNVYRKLGFVELRREKTQSLGY